MKNGEIKILHVENKICAVLPSKYFSYILAEPKNFIDFISYLRQDYPQYKLRCVLDKELEEKIKSRLHPQKVFVSLKGVER